MNYLKIVVKKLGHFALTFFITLSVTISLINAQESLRTLAQKRNFNIGAAIGSAFWEETNPLYKTTLQKEFNILVAENYMKFELIEPSRNKFTWTKGDDLVNYAQQNGMLMRGHNLVWGSQSRWAENLANIASKTEMLAILKNHIDSVVTHFKGKIYEWDVVNEGIEDNTGKLRANFWFKSIGPEYIDSAFVWAHRADPKAFLIYNDYDNEATNIKSDSIFAFLKSLRARGIPVHGVGLQCHLKNSDPLVIANIDKNIKRLSGLGLRISFTEVDFMIALPTNSTTLELQKNNYKNLLGVCLANDSCHTFLTWGFTDKYSWVPEFFPGNGSALPIDENYNPKPAYEGLKLALQAATSIRGEKNKPSRRGQNRWSNKNISIRDFITSQGLNAIGKRSKKTSVN